MPLPRTCYAPSRSAASATLPRPPSGTLVVVDRRTDADFLRNDGGAWECWNDSSKGQLAVDGVQRLAFQSTSGVPFSSISRGRSLSRYAREARNAGPLVRRVYHLVEGYARGSRRRHAHGSHHSDEDALHHLKLVHYLADAAGRHGRTVSGWGSRADGKAAVAERRRARHRPPPPGCFNVYVDYNEAPAYRVAPPE